MLATNHVHTDLFGMPIRVDTADRPARRRQKKLQDRLAHSSNLVLFEELLNQLKKPLFKTKSAIPQEFHSDVGSVAPKEEDSEVESDASAVEIPFEPWGAAFVTDDKGLQWSKESLIFTQVRLFWRSMEELALNNNEQEKWSVLRWIFRPAFWNYYVYDKRIGKSRCFRVHERDETFSFHNCCMASMMNADVVREGVRRHMTDDMIKAVERVCTFD